MAIKLTLDYNSQDAILNGSQYPLGTLNTLVAGDMIMFTNVNNGGLVQGPYHYSEIELADHTTFNSAAAVLTWTGAHLGALNSGASTAVTSPTRDIVYINEPFSGSALPSGWTAVGGLSYTVSGGRISFTGTPLGGGFDFGKYVRSDLGTLTESNTLSATIRLDVPPSATLLGAAIGFESYNPQGYNFESMRAGIVTDSTSAHYGHIFLEGGYPSPDGTILFSTLSNTDLNSGDVLSISLKHQGWIWRVIVTNVTQDWTIRYDQEITDSVSPLAGPNSGHPAIYHLGGSVSVEDFKYVIHAPSFTDILMLGNSITYGQAASTQHDRWVNRVGIYANNMASGGGADITQSVVDRLPEIVAIKPVRVIIHDLAGNDILFGISSATWQANLNTIRSTLVAAGIEVIWTNGQPRNGTNETAQKTFIEATFAGDLIVDTWNVLKGSGTSLNAIYDSGDGTHPNDAGMLATANAINSALGYPQIVVGGGGGTLTLLEDKVFTAAGSWTLAADTGNSASIVSNALEIVAPNPSYAVAYKAGVFVVGDNLKITIYGVSNNSGVLFLGVGDGAGAPESQSNLSNGTNVINVNTAGYASGHNYIILGNNNISGVNATCTRIKIEKY